MAFSGFLHEKRKAERVGEKPAIYTAPEVEICAYALEKGFAGSPLYPKGSNPATKDYGGEEMDVETWDVSNF